MTQVKRKRLAFLSRMPAVHVAVCGLSVVGACLVPIILVQNNWETMLGGIGLRSSSERAIVSTLAAMAWLLASACLHFVLSRNGQARVVLTANDSRLNLLTDSVLIGVTAAIIWRGHESPLAASGIWSLCPVAFVIAVLSASALALSRADVATPSALRQSTRVLVRGRPLVAVLLILILGVVSAW